MKTRALLFILLFSFCFGFGQEEPSPSGNWLITLNVPELNPAFAGEQGRHAFNSFIKLDHFMPRGYPIKVVQNYTAQIPKLRSGVGVSLGHSSAFASNAWSMALTYNFMVKFRPDHYLRIGVSGGIEYYQVDYFEFIDPNFLNEGFITNIGTNFIGTVQAGIWYVYRDYFLGLSVVNPHQPQFWFFEEPNPRDLDGWVLPVNFYLHSGYTFRVSERLSLIPILHLKYELDRSLTFRHTFSAEIDERYWMGVSASSTKGFIQAGIQPIKQVRVFYGFGFPFAGAVNYTSGIHEFGLSFIL